MPTRTLTSLDVEHLVEGVDLLATLEAAHRSLARGRAVQPQPSTLRDAADTRIDAPTIVPMMAYDASLGLFAIKVLADAPRNRSQGLPAQRSTICVFSTETGECLAIVDGRALTRIRTAAVTALATRTLARPESGVLTLLGSGALAIEHARAIAPLYALDELRLWSRSEERSSRAAAELRGAGLPAVAVTTLERAVSGADIVCTLTPSLEPIFAAGLVEGGMHINAVGSPPRPVFSEIAPDVFTRVDVAVVDSRAVALSESGNIREAIHAGTWEAGSLVELGEVLEGMSAGRSRREDVTVYNSVGIGLQDLAAAHHVLRRAEARDAGTMVKIRD